MLLNLSEITLFTSYGGDRSIFIFGNCIIRPTSIENHNKSPDKKNSEAWLREHVISLFKPELYTMRKVLNCMNNQNGVRFQYFKYVGFDTTRRMLN